MPNAGASPNARDGKKVCAHRLKPASPSETGSHLAHGAENPTKGWVCLVRAMQQVSKDIFMRMHAIKVGVPEAKALQGRAL